MVRFGANCTCESSGQLNVDGSDQFSCLGLRTYVLVFTIVFLPKLFRLCEISILIIYITIFTKHVNTVYFEISVNSLCFLVHI